MRPARVASLVLALGLALAVMPSLGCAKKPPAHAGYAVGTSQAGPTRPWAKPSSLKLDARGRLAAELTLSYPKRARAKWLAIDVPASGALTLAVETFPTSGGDVAVGVELYDPSLIRLLAEQEAAMAAEELPRRPAQVVGEADEDGFVTEADEEPRDDVAVAEGEAGPRTYTFEHLAPGRYLVHLFVSRRLDEATVEVVGKFASGPGPSAAGGDALMVADVALLPPLPLVPVADDSPASKSSRDRARDHDVRKPDTKPGPRRDKPEKPEKPDKLDKPDASIEPAPPGVPSSARIINVSVIAGGTEITINRGADHGLAPGVVGQVAGVRQGAFTLASCAPRTCKAVVKASANDLAGASKVTLKP